MQIVVFVWVKETIIFPDNFSWLSFIFITVSTVITEQIIDTGRN